MGGRHRKKGGRVTPKGGAPIGRLTGSERAGLTEIFDRMLRSAPGDLTDDLPPVAAEMWASQVWSIWAKSELVGMDAVDVFAGGLISHAATTASEAALMVLRTLGAVAPEPYGSRARREAERLAAAGVAERRWAETVGTGDPTMSWLSFDPIDDDGVNVMVGFDGPGEPTTVGVYIDHNLGGMAKDAFAVPAGVDEVLAKMRESHDDPEPHCRQIPLEEAASPLARRVRDDRRVRGPAIERRPRAPSRPRHGPTRQTASGWGGPDARDAGRGGERAACRRPRGGDLGRRAASRCERKLIRLRLPRRSGLPNRVTLHILDKPALGD